LGVLIALVVGNGLWVAYDIRKEILLNKELADRDLKIQDKIILDIYRQLEKLGKKIDGLPQKIQVDKIKLEQKLKQVNVVIENTTMGSYGSGVSIKYKGKFYVISAGHMADNDTDVLWLGENGNQICEMEIIKHSFTTPEEDTNGDFTKGEDLILLRPKNPNFQPKFYVEIADKEPITGSEIYVIGNPMGIEDVVSDGRVIVYKNNFMYYIDHTYYGNSGGGVYTVDGKLVGVVSHLYPIQPNKTIPPYMIYGAVRLDTVLKFLEGVEDNEG
jgi:S1-C subfamily serine protease